MKSERITVRKADFRWYIPSIDGVEYPELVGHNEYYARMHAADKIEEMKRKTK